MCVREIVRQVGEEADSCAERAGVDIAPTAKPCYLRPFRFLWKAY